MQNDPRSPLVIAHRGASSYAPENTIAAFKKAVDMGFDLIENDVRRTIDGTIVVSHDGSLDRCTDGSGQIAELTLDQVKAASAGIKFAPEYKDERIPTLEEALKAVPANVGYCIELKVPGLAEDVVRTVEQAGHVGRTVIFAFDGSNGPIVKAANPLISFLHLVGGPAEEKIARVPKIIEDAMMYQADIVGIAHNLLSPELVNAARHRGLSVWVWTVDDFERARECVLGGVDGIISNKPDVAREAVDAVYTAVRADL
jgi:glycerophosphoryl diester phosphodiesterase